MENQVQQLKLNAENIRSVLVSSNKTISKLKIKKKNIENKQLKLKKREEREKKIEAKSSFLKSSARNINKSIPSTPLKIFDKIMQFGFLILAGIITESLPKIIEKIQEMVKGIQEIADVIKNKVEDIFNFMTNTFGDSYEPTGDYKESKEKIDKDIENIKKQAGNLEKLIPDNMQEMLTAMQSAMGIQGTPIKTNGSETASKANKNTKDVDKITNTNGKSDSIGNTKGAISQGGTTNNGLNIKNLQTMSSYDQFSSTDFKSVFGKNMDTSNLSNSTFNFSTSLEGLNITPLVIDFTNITESDSSTSSNTKDVVILRQTNTEIVPVPVGGGSDGGGEITVNSEISRAFAEL